MEFRAEIDPCSRCDGETITPEERKEELMGKLEVYKKNKNEKLHRR